MVTLRRMYHFAVGVVLCLAVLPVAGAAATSTWLLTDVVFSDGGTATGWFDYDPSMGTVPRWAITTGGGNTVQFPLHTYDTQNSSVLIFNAGDPQDRITFFGDTGIQNRARNLRITPVAPLTDAGGTIALDLATGGSGSGGVECYNCAPSRLITAGSLWSLGSTGQTSLYLNEGRFRAEVSWRSAAGEEGVGRVVPFDRPFGGHDSGLFYFFEVKNWELLVKVLNGCSITGHFWVFATAASNVGFTLKVTDTASGSVREYGVPADVEVADIRDTAAFACP